jgi:hypothetical protein
MFVKKLMLDKLKVFCDENSKNLVELLHGVHVNSIVIVRQGVPHIRKRGSDQMQNVDTLKLIVNQLLTEQVTVNDNPEKLLTNYLLKYVMS